MALPRPRNPMSSGLSFVGVLNGKGPCRESENAYKKAKTIYTKMLGLCTGAVGCAPGMKQRTAMEKLEGELVTCFRLLIHADRATSERAKLYHSKFQALVPKITTMLKQQRRQVRVDVAFAAVQEAFHQVLWPNHFAGIMKENHDAVSYNAETIERIFAPHVKATKEAVELASQSTGGAVLLTPMEGGWLEALQAAKKAGLLSPGFPDLSVWPMSKIAAIEAKIVMSTKREGITRSQVKEGELRLLTSAEYAAMLQRQTGEEDDTVDGKLKVTYVRASERDVIYADWVKFPSGTNQTALLMQAEFLEIEPSATILLADFLEGLLAKWNWFALDLSVYVQLRELFKEQQLNWYGGYERIMIFPRAYLKCVLENLEDQLAGAGPGRQKVIELIREITERASLSEEEVFEGLVDEDDEDEEEDGDPEYLELDAEELRPPPVNQDYLDGGWVQSRSPVPASAPPLSARVPEFEDLPRAQQRRQSRSSSDSGQAGDQFEGAVAATTASQLRGDDPTHTIALQMQRCRQILQSMEADPDCTRYKNQRAKLEKMQEMAERHFRDVVTPSSYDEFLNEEMERCEHVCAAKDDEFDVAEKKRKQKQEEKKDLMATLPKGLGRKFNGTPADWPYFRDHFERIANTVDASLAVDQMMALVDCKSLKSRMKIYKDGFEILKHFEQDYGHSWLNCQTILNKINNLKNSTSQKDEMDLILQFRQAKRALEKNEDKGTVLNVGHLTTWADKLLPPTTAELMKIIQDSGYGVEWSPVESFFENLERVYERNSVLTRNRESLAAAAKNTPGEGKGGKKVEFETDQRSYSGVDSSETGSGCSKLCNTGPRHWAFNCPLLKKDGKAAIKRIKQVGLCTCCVSAPGDCKKGLIKRKDGTTVQIACPECKYSKRINCHQKCKKLAGGSKSKADSGAPGRLDAPPVELEEGTSAPASISELRTESYCLVNPNKLGSALEFVDHCMLQAPDGSQMIVRTIFDGGGTDSILDWRLNRFFHHDVPCKVGVNGFLGDKKYDSHIGDLKIIRSDGSYLYLKAIKGDLSSKAFTIKRKFVDIPPPLQHHFGNSVQSYNEMGDIRYYNAPEDFQVQLIVGLDAVALFAPMELGRTFDEFGQLVLWRSVISNNLMVTGSRKTGSAASGRGGAHQRSYVIAEEGHQQVSLLRTAVETGDSRDLFAKRSNLTKVERKLFAHIEDSDEIVPPQPELCPSCQGCEVCADPFKARREQTVINLLDQLVTFQEGSREDGGGYHVRLLYDPEILAQVPEGREAALRRLLATERQLSRPGMAQAREYFNQKVQQCIDKGYLVKPEAFQGASSLQKAYQPYSFALKDQERLDGKEVGAPEHKTRARPVVDCSAAAFPGGASVNGAQYKIPDVHTLKISQILLQLRTAKRFCIGDISEYYYRLWCDPLTSSLTRVLFREGGLGGQGEIMELISLVSSMGLKQISTLSAHVRYRISLIIASIDEEAARQLRGAYCDDVSLFEKYGECRREAKDKHVCENGEVLVQRATLVEEALNHAHLHLGQRWISDVEQGKCSEKMVGVDADQGEHEEMTVVLGNSNHTSALGYRLHLGPSEPPGGTIRWRVHRPQSINLEPKMRGARPDWAQLASSSDIRSYLKTHGATKSSLLSLCSNLFDPLLLAASFISSARQLFRQVLREVKLTSWKDLVPECYHERIAQLAEDLLEVARKLEVPRSAVVANPMKEEEHEHPYGFATLLVVADGSGEAGIAAAYVHQMFPYESGLWAADADFSQVTVTCRLLCSALKLTDNSGHNSQVDGELLAKFIACQLKDFVLKNSLIRFHRVRICSDSLTVEKAIRKTEACYSTWAGKRIASIQRSIDLDDSWHVPHEVTDATVDRCTKYQKHPSKAMDDCWFYGKGVLDKPIQLLPYTCRSTYVRPRLDDFPAQWLSSAARTFLGLKLPTVVIMKVAVEEEPPEMTLLEQLANKYRDVDKAISVLQCLLKMQPKFRQLSVPAQREACRVKFISSDYEKISQQLGKRSRRMTQQLLLEDDKERRVFTLKGRFGYRATLLASPKTSLFAKLVLQSAHDKHHVTNSSRIMAKVGRHYAFTGGALSYLDQLREKCHMCRLLKPEAVKLLLGNTPPFMRGMLPDATTTWRHQSTDIFGPWMMAAFPGSRGTRAGQKRIKAYGLLVFDYSTRAIDATLIEDYSASSVILGLKTIWSRVGRPQWLGFDAASNIASAEEIVAGDPDLQMPSLVEAERLQQALRERLGGMIELRPRVPYAPFRQVAEMGVQFCKREIRKMLQQSAGGLLTPLQASAILSEAVAHINERPLVIHVAPDDRGVLTPWFLSARNMSTFHSQNVELNEDLDHPLSRRAFQAQQRLDLFKGMFNVYYFKEMVKFGHWNTKGKQPAVGDVVLVLDKTKPKAHFLQKFQLGRIRRFISEHVCEIDFVKQDQKVTSALIRGLRSRSQDWRENYKVKISTCTRDLRSITIVCAHSQEGELRKGFEIDLMVDQRHGLVVDQQREEGPMVDEPQPGLVVDQQREEDLVVDQQGEEAEGGIGADDLLQPAPTPDKASGAVSGKTKRKVRKERWITKQ